MKRILIWMIFSMLLAASWSSVNTQAQIAINKKGRALLVGVNHYKYFPNKPTPGSEEDAIATKDFIKRQYGFRDEEILLFLGQEATAQRLMEQFRRWLVEGTEPGDRVFFLYSGHGTRVKDVTTMKPMAKTRRSRLTMWIGMGTI